ncbi:Translation initiation factor eIF-2B subunit beta [Schistosoma japonicum]|nr:Translation initiation factor eIF-2B subunit beta [Schistosoma japonicum]KAH8861296.1 Translation initiation factor eIF-2B subunit beta [Schistosoma japonicum]KAH8861297.1 Translation initiation factor eIF-2B subunit beta [Schistosoma japonicum]KAH8861298.1 Translation initiation factor eIF-2B subunit beta [Schistosoma japonicum]
MLQSPPINRNSSIKTSLSTLNILKHTVESEEWCDLKSLIVLIIGKLRNLCKYSDDNTVVLNTTLRVLKAFREEALKFQMGENADFEENLTNPLFAVGNEDYETVSRNEILEPFVDTLNDLALEIKSCLTSLGDLSLDFIHSDELIMTSGYSKAVHHFLRHAAKKGRNFKVIICECYPDNLGHKLAEDLSKDNVDVILVPDSHAFGLMSRINKVIVSCHAVYPDGTLKATVGTYGVMLAAKNFSIPIYVCLPHHKLSPIPFKHSSRSTPLFSVQPTANPSDSSADWLDSPSVILPPNDQGLVSDGLVYHQPIEGPVVWVPKWEIIPSGFVSLFLTNLGTHAPSYLYALERELFHSADIKTIMTLDQ